MDKQEQHHSFITAITQQQELPPALLWEGNSEELNTTVHTFLQERLCALDGCGHCSICKQIAEHQHPQIRWIHPAKTYTRDNLADIFSTISFSLEHNEECFFVVHKADMLTAACYNSLLKSIEEPPRGYHFIFLTERVQEVARTIRSRCVVHQFMHSNNSLISHPVAQFFLPNQKPDALNFMYALEQASVNEQESARLIDDLINYWTTRYKKLIATNNQPESTNAHHILSLLTKSMEEPITPGSSTIFWKTLFLQVYA